MERKPFQRNHVSDAQRLIIGGNVHTHRGVYGYITQLARNYVVSRWFIYYCYVHFLLAVEQCSCLEQQVKAESAYVCPLELEYLVLTVYLDTESSVSGVRRSLEDLFKTPVSEGQIAKFLTKHGGMLSATEERELPVVLSFEGDEMFGHAHPVLVTIEPHSGYILVLTGVERRDKATWNRCWLDLFDAESGEVKRVISDHGKGLVGAINETFCGEVFQEDLFHVMTRLGHLLWVLERKAYKMIRLEYEAEARYQKAKPEEQGDLGEAYEQAWQVAHQQITVYDSYLPLFRALQRVLEIVNEETGALRRKAEVQEEIEVILELMEELDSEAVTQGVAYFRKHLATLLPYFDDLAVAEELLAAQIPDADIGRILNLLYYYQTQCHTACGKRLQALRARIGFWEEGLSEWLGKAEFERLYGIVSAQLSRILRSSSMVENTNSRLRRFFDAARGQMSQERLNLIRHYLNHKVYTRGRRAGFSPRQLFFQEDSPIHWLEALKQIEAEKNAA